MQKTFIWINDDFKCNITYFSMLLAEYVELCIKYFNKYFKYLSNFSYEKF